MKDFLHFLHSVQTQGHLQRFTNKAKHSEEKKQKDVRRQDELPAIVASIIMYISGANLSMLLLQALSH